MRRVVLAAAWVALALPSGASGRAGDVDRSWGAGGFADLQLDELGSITSVVPGPAGTSLVLSTTATAEYRLQRITAKGRLDRSFGARGGVAVPGLPSRGGRALTVDPSGRSLVLVGEEAPDGGSPRAMRVLAFDSGGRADSSWGADGVVRIPLPKGGSGVPLGLFRRPDGRMVVLAQTGSRFRRLLLTGLTADGRPDRRTPMRRLPAYVSRFGLRFQTARLLHDGSLALAGLAFDEGISMLVGVLIRLRPNGEPDLALGPRGVRRMTFTPVESYDSFEAIGSPRWEFSADGRLYVAISQPQPQVFRWRRDGRLDRGWGDDGTARAPGAPVLSMAALVPTPDGGVVVVGTKTAARAYSSRTALWRLTSRGDGQRALGPSGLRTVRVEPRGVSSLSRPTGVWLARSGDALVSGSRAEPRPAYEGQSVPGLWLHTMPSEGRR